MTVQSNELIKIQNVREKFNLNNVENLGIDKLKNDELFNEVCKEEYFKLINLNDNPKSRGNKIYKGILGIEDNYGRYIKDELIILDFDKINEKQAILKILEHLGVNTFVTETTRGVHIYFKNNTPYKGNQSEKINYFGLHNEVKLGTRKTSEYPVIEGKNRRILNFVKYDDIPALPWFLHTPSNTKPKEGMLGMVEHDGRNDILYRYIPQLYKDSLDRDDSILVMDTINQCVFGEPMDDYDFKYVSRPEAFENMAEIAKDGLKKKPWESKSDFLEKHKVVKYEGEPHVWYQNRYRREDVVFMGLMQQMDKTLSSSQQLEIYTQIKSDMDIEGVDDSHLTKYVGFKNGNYNLETGELEELDSSIFIKNVLAVDYVDQPDCTRALKYLTDWANGKECVAKILAEIIGYSMYSKNSMKRVFFMVGESNCGKSTYFEMLQAIIGDENFSVNSLEEISSEYGTAELEGTLLNIGDDIASLHHSNLENMKKIVDGNKINYKQKYEKAFKFKPYVTLLFSVNKMPTTGDKTNGVYNRLTFIRFENLFEVDNDKKEETIQTDLLLQFAYLGIQGLRDVIKNKTFNKEALKYSEIEKIEYKKENDSVEYFFAERDPLNGRTEILRSDIYTEYNLFCWEFGITKKVNLATFTHNMHDHGYKVERRGSLKIGYYIKEVK